MKTILSILILCALGVSVAKAQSSLPVRLAALSQIESGDQDDVVGECGEVSRYQITPQTIADCGLRIAELKNPERAHEAAVTIMDARVKRFEHWITFYSYTVDGINWSMVLTNKPPKEARFSMEFQASSTGPISDFDWYLLWHRPAVLLHGRTLTAAERDRAERFSNLCTRLATETQRH